MGTVHALAAISLKPTTTRRDNLTIARRKVLRLKFDYGLSVPGSPVA